MINKVSHDIKPLTGVIIELLSIRCKLFKVKFPIALHSFHSMHSFNYLYHKINFLTCR